MTNLTKEDIQSTLHLSSRQAAKQLGVGKTTVNDYRKIYGATREIILPNANVLIIDIESKPGLGYFWSPKVEWLPIKMMKEPPAMLCFAAKWLGEDETVFYSEWEHGTEGMVVALRKLLITADIVVTYNGDRYDIRKINNEFLKLNMAPPSPFRSIDLFKTNRARFDLPYKSLDYMASVLDVGTKVKHAGFDLWLDVMAGDPEAQAKMQEYNEGDVTLTERTYIKLLPWLTNVPHMGMFAFEGGTCPYCASDDVRNTGDTTATFVQRYELFQCNNCEGWSRGNKPLADTPTTRATR